MSRGRAAAVTALFFALRVPLLFVRPPFFDELFTRWISAKPFAGIVDALRFDSGPPLYYFVLHLLRDGRLVSLLCATIAFVLVLRRSVAAAAVIAVLPPAVLFAVDARAYAMCAMFATIALLASEDERPIAAAFALVLAAYSHYYGVVFFPLLLAGAAPRGRRIAAFALALFLYIPGFALALHQPAQAREWMRAFAWPDAIFVRPPLALAIVAMLAVVAMLLRARDELRLIAWIVVPLAAAILLRAYVPFRFEAVIAAPFALWIARRKPALIPATALLAMLTVWSILGIFDHASRPADPYRDAATWLATHVPPTETVAASGYLYLETLMSGRKHVVALPQEQAQHPGWRALPPREGLPTPAGTFLWIGERGAPELAIVARAGRSVEPLYINPRAMVARIR